MPRTPSPRSPSPLSSQSNQSWQDTSQASLEDRMALARSWVSQPSVTFSLLRAAGPGERSPREQEEDSEEEEEEEEESTESEVEPELMEEEVFDDLSCISYMPYLLELDVSHNALTTYFDFRPPKNLQVLQVLDLSGNQISSLEGLEDHNLLQDINLEDNQVSAVNKYDPPQEVAAAQDHMTHIMYSMMQPQHIFNSPCHTTRSPYFGEENKLDYHYVSQEEFDKMVNTGKFIVTFKYNGFYYGLSREIIETIAREGLATCVHLEIEGVRSLKNSYFEPRYILLIPVNKEKYGGHLRRMGLFSRPEIEEALRRVDMYTRVNQDFPGFFDAVINVDDYDEAFSKLSSLLEEFLGLVQPSESKVVKPTAGSKYLSGTKHG
ncbi:hypothetical protein E2320_004392 [Naja naja]|nr:hypothetical protein E2320_004392 [Naja naja]